MTRISIQLNGPLSRRFDVASVRDGSGTAFRVESTEAERQALAAEYDIVRHRCARR